MKLLTPPEPVYNRLFVKPNLTGRVAVPAGSLLYWLTLAAVADWLIGRTFSRSAIFMPKPPPVMVIYQGLAVAGQLASALTGLLALGMLGWIAWYEWRNRRTVWLPLVLLAQAGLSLVFLFVAPAGWWPVVYHGLTLAAVGLMVRFWIYDLRFTIYGYTGSGESSKTDQTIKQAMALLAPAMALLLGKLYQIMPALYAAMGWPGPAPLTEFFFNLGELWVVLSSVGLWYAYGRGAARPTWLVAALPAVAFSAAYLANPSMTGILAIWSIGLSLYLPWLLYALSLWLAGVTVVVSMRQKSLAGWAILLLAAGGYAPQLSTQIFLSLIAVWLLAYSFGPQAEQARTSEF